VLYGCFVIITIDVCVECGFFCW